MEWRGPCFWLWSFLVHFSLTFDGWIGWTRSCHIFFWSFVTLVLELKLRPQLTLKCHENIVSKGSGMPLPA